MPKQQTTAWTASDPKAGLTLAELRQFVTATDELFADDAVVKTRVTLAGRVKSITVVEAVR